MEKFILTFIVAGSLMAAGCGKQQEQAAVPQQGAEIQAMEVTDQAATASQEAAQAVSQASQDMKAAGNNLVDQAQQLLAQAKQLLDSGKFEEAITAAQKVLSIDPSNIEAKNILETAKAKLAAMAQEKAGALKNDLTNKINSFGN